MKSEKYKMKKVSITNLDFLTCYSSGFLGEDTFNAILMLQSKVCGVHESYNIYDGYIEKEEIDWSIFN